MKNETALKAAKWWADKLRHGCKFDNGDDSETGAMSMMLGIMLAEAQSEKRNEADIEAFEAMLAQDIWKLDMHAARYGFGVDYHPDRILSNAAALAGIVVDGSLPWKTHMRIKGDDIFVAEGYGKESVKL